MGRRNIDWLQLILVVLTILGAALHMESRLARVEQHLADQDREDTAIQGHLDKIEESLRR